MKKSTLNACWRVAPGVAILSVLYPEAAHAYIGPGAGLGAIAVTVALAIGLLLLLVGLVWYPLKRLLKRKQIASAESAGKDGAE